MATFVKHSYKSNSGMADITATFVGMVVWNVAIYILILVCQRNIKKIKYT